MIQIIREIKNHLKDEEGYSLVSVLIISQLLIVLTVGFLMVAFFTNVLNAKFANKRKLDLLCRSAIELDKQHTLAYPYEKYVLEIDSTEILMEKRLKGLFIETTASCRNSMDSSKLKAVWGNSDVSQFENALTLSESRARLAVAGETYIAGDIAFDGTKISEGKVSGMKNSPGLFHDGDIYTNSVNDEKAFTESIFLMSYEENRTNYDTTISKKEFVLSEKNIQCFLGKRILITGELNIQGEIKSSTKINQTEFIVNNKVNIKSDTDLECDIKIRSDSAVNIEKDVQIKNCIIVTEAGIKISENSTFTNTQFLSEKEILIEGSQFNYPTIIGLYVDVSDDNLLNSLLQVNSSNINGSILLLCSEIGISENKSKIQINNSTVKGIIYSENLTEIEGKIIGSLYTYRLYYYKSPTEYINWMINLNIKRDELEELFLFPAGFKNSTNYELLDKVWVY